MSRIFDTDLRHSNVGSTPRYEHPLWPVAGMVAFVLFLVVFYFFPSPVRGAEMYQISLSSSAEAAAKSSSDYEECVGKYAPGTTMCAAYIDGMHTAIDMMMKMQAEAQKAQAAADLRSAIGLRETIILGLGHEILASEIAQTHINERRLERASSLVQSQVNRFKEMRAKVCGQLLSFQVQLGVDINLPQGCLEE